MEDVQSRCINTCIICPLSDKSCQCIGKWVLFGQENAKHTLAWIQNWYVVSDFRKTWWIQMDLSWIFSNQSLRDSVCLRTCYQINSSQNENTSKSPRNQQDNRPDCDKGPSQCLLIGYTCVLWLSLSLGLQQLVQVT